MTHTPKTDAELLAIYDKAWNEDDDLDTPTHELERVAIRAVYEAGVADGPERIVPLVVGPCEPGEHSFPALRMNGTACILCGAEP